MKNFHPPAPPRNGLAPLAAGKLALALCATLLSGCAALSTPSAIPSPAQQRLQPLETAKHAVAEDPQDIEAKTVVHRQRQTYVYDELKDAQAALTANDAGLALTHAYNVLREEPGNFLAAQLAKTANRRVHSKAELEQAVELFHKNKSSQALDIVGKILAEQPSHLEARQLRDEILRQRDSLRASHSELDDALRKPVSLNFRAQPLVNIFNAISRVAGVNFVFDKDVQTSASANLLAAKITAEDAINTLLHANQLEKKVLDASTLLIYPARPDKERIYRDNAVRTFFLSEAEAKSVAAAIRQVVKPKSMHVDDRTNAIIVRDTPETVAVIERVIQAMDLAQSEVTMDVQILEVNSNDVIKLGVEHMQRLGFSLGNETTPATLGDFLSINRNQIQMSGISAAINTLQKVGKTKILANPKIRVRSQAKAQIKIVEKLPIVTTNTSSVGATSETVAYQDVGITLNVEPRVSLNDEVSVKLSLEVSTVTGREARKNGTLYTIGTRNTETTMTARNGETQVLGGLIRQQDIHNSIGLPWVNRIPLLGYLFGSRETTDEKSEIVLLITPRIERNLDLPAAAVSTFLAGTEAQSSTAGVMAPSNGTNSTAQETAPAKSQENAPPQLSDPIQPQGTTEPGKPAGTS